MKKILVLILALLLAFSFSAFAQSEDPANTSEGTAAPEATKEKSAEFNRSLDVYGVYTWTFEYDWFNRNIDANTQLNGAILYGTAAYGGSGGTNYPFIYPDAKRGKTVDIFTYVYHQVEANFTYNISESLQLKFSLAWGGFYGTGRSRGFYSKFQGSYVDAVSPLGVPQDLRTSEWNIISSAYTVDKINVKQMYMVWKIGGPLGQLQIGRQDTTWGYHSVFAGSYAGADRFAWLGNLNIAGWMTLPLVWYELRKDTSMYATNDAQHLLGIAWIMVDPTRGKFIEQLWVGLGYYFPDQRVITSGAVTGITTADLTSGAYIDAGTGLLNFKERWKLLTPMVYTKLRMGSLLEINFEVFATLGSRGYYYAYATGQGGHQYRKTWNSVSVLLNTIIKLGFLEIKPEFVFITAPDITSDAAANYTNANGATLNKTGSAAGWFAAAVDYQIGGRLMNGVFMGYIPGSFDGLFMASVQVNAKLMGGKIDPWLKIATSFALSKYRNLANVEGQGNMTTVVGTIPGNQGAYYFTTMDNNRFWGIEIDLGVNIQLTDGLTMYFEFDWWMPGKRARLYSSATYGAVNGGVLAPKSAVGTLLKFELKF